MGILLPVWSSWPTKAHSQPQKLQRPSKHSVMRAKKGRLTSMLWYSSLNCNNSNCSRETDQHYKSNNVLSNADMYANTP